MYSWMDVEYKLSRQAEGVFCVLPREVAWTCTTGDSRICWPVDYCCRETCPKPCPTRGLRSASSKQTSDFYHRDRTRYTECHREAQRQPPFGRAGTIILRHGSPAGNRQQRRARGTILSFSVALRVPRSVSVVKIACFKPRDHLASPIVARALRSHTPLTTRPGMREIRQRKSRTMARRDILADSLMVGRRLTS